MTSLSTINYLIECINYTIRLQKIQPNISPVIQNNYNHMNINPSHHYIPNIRQSRHNMNNQKQLRRNHNIRQPGYDVQRKQLR